MDTIENKLIFKYTSSISSLKESAFSTSKHTHGSMHELIYVENGELTYIIEGKKYNVIKNSIIYTRPTMYHLIEVKPNTKYVRFNILFNSNNVDKNILKKIPKKLDVIQCPSPNNILDNFKKIINNTNAKNISTILKDVILEISYLSKKVNYTRLEISPILNSTLEYINDNLYNITNIDDVCKELSISRPYLFKLFNKQLKISPKQYILNKKLAYANSQIEKGVKPYKIFKQLGFSSYEGFYKQYKKIFGYSPRENINNKKML